LQSITTEELLTKDNAFVFIHSRFCGTCHVARGFLQKIEMTHQQDIFYEVNASFVPDFLQNYQIESVPCLLIISNNEVKEKIYTFYSIANIYHYLLEYMPELFAQS
jgi:hypothetical protein